MLDVLDTLVVVYFLLSIFIIFYFIIPNEEHYTEPSTLIVIENQEYTSTQNYKLLESDNKQFVLTFEQNGSLRLSNTKTNEAVWSGIPSLQSRVAPFTLKIDSGNLEIIDSNKIIVWQTNTQNVFGISQLILDNDGNLSLIDKQNGFAFWKR